MSYIITFFICISAIIFGQSSIHAADIKTSATQDYAALEQELITCATYGKTKRLREIVKYPIDINARDTKDNTALMRAAEHGHYKCLKYLLRQKNIDVNSQDRNENTALIKAACYGRTQCVTKLLQHKKNRINTRNNKGETALILAVFWNRIACVNALLKKIDIGINIHNNQGKNALMLAVYLLDIESTRMLLNHYPPHDINAQDNEGKTALMLSEDTECTQALLEKKARINDQDNRGNTALIWAVYNENEACIRQLLTNPTIAINTQNDAGHNALMILAQGPIRFPHNLNHNRCIKTLLARHDIDINTGSAPRRAEDSGDYR